MKTICLSFATLVAYAALFAACTISDPIRVISLSLDESTLALTEGESHSLIVTVAPSDADNKNVSWDSDRPEIATVDADGVVKAMKAGTANITVTSENGEKSATCTVTVKAAAVAVTGLKLDKSELELKPDDQFRLKVVVSPSNATDKNVTWRSSEPAVATVDASGLVVALTEGTTTITVTSVSDKTVIAKCVVTVKPHKLDPVAVTDVTLESPTLTLPEGESHTLTFVIAPDDATITTVTWNSSNPTVATVDKNGKVTAVKAGSTIITVTTDQGKKTDQCTVTVTVPIKPVTAITIAPADAVTVKVGATTTLSATIAPADATDRSVKWSSKNPSRATVDPVTGVVTGVSAGTVLIAATANDKSGVETTKSVTVLSATRVQAGPITGVTSPKAGAAPSRGINGGTGYTAYLAWISSPSVFAYGTRYTAEITLTATPGFTFSGGYANNYQVADFKVNGNAPEWVANDGKTLKLRVWFPITESAPLPVVTIESQPAPTLTFTEGAIQGSLSVVASATQGATPNYEWFWSTQNVNTGGTATGYLGQTYTLPADLPVGTRYYYCSVGALSPTGVQAKRVSSAVAVVTVLPHTYAISVSEPVTFGSLQTPYTQPEPQTVTITNSGTGEVTLTQPSAINYIIGNLSPGVKIAKGGTATFTIQPKADLEVGDYNETIFIEGMKDVTGSVTVQFTVTAASGNDITYGPGNNDTKW